MREGKEEGGGGHAEVVEVAGEEVSVVGQVDGMMR